MSTTLSTAARNAACDAVVDLVDVGGGGKIRIKSAGGTVIAEVPFAATAFGSAVAGVATAAGAPLTGAGITAAGVGTAPATFDVCNAANEVIWSGVVGVGAELDLGADPSIVDGQVVTIDAFTHAQPA